MTVRRKVSEIVNNVSTLDHSYYLKGGFWLAASYSVIALIRLLQAALLTRITSAELFGQYQFTASVISALFVFSLPGMDGAIIQSIAKGFPSSLKRGAKLKLRWSIISSASLLVFAALFAFQEKNAIAGAFLVASLLFPTYSSFTCTLAYFRGMKNFKGSAIAESLMHLVNTIALLGAFAITNSLIYSIAAMMTFGSLPYLLIYLSKAGSIPAEPFDPELEKNGKALTFIHAVSFLTPYADRFIITFILGFETLAAYTVAMSLVLYLAAGGKLLGSLLLPKLASNNESHEKKLRTLIFAFAFLTACALAGIALIIPTVIGFIFPQTYSNTAPLAQTALIALAFSIPSTILTAYFQTRGRIRLLSLYQTGYFALNLTILLALIPLAGIWGAVVSKIIIDFIGFVFLTAVFFKSTAIY